MFTSKDQAYMQRALELAGRGFRRTWPNPMVGAVLVKNGKVIAEGWHHQYGDRHAEIEALRTCSGQAKGATLYLNLEPCSHFGKTPPCATALVAARIKRVICAMQDPNPKISGKGFAILRRAGIEVKVGLMQKEARKLNRVFLKLIRTDLPYVVNKMAISMDGKIACHNGKSRWITSLDARQYAHELRRTADAILVGAQTVFQDDPELSIRLVPNPEKRRPLRVVLEGRRRIPAHLKIFKNCEVQRVVIATTLKPARACKYPAGVERWILPGSKNRVGIKALLQKLRLGGVNYLLVEGGAEVHADFLGLGERRQEVLADEVQMILAPKLIGGRAAPGAIGGKGADDPQRAVRLEDLEWGGLGEDLLLSARPKRSRTI